MAYNSIEGWKVQHPGYIFSLFRSMVDDCRRAITDNEAS